MALVPPRWRRVTESEFPWEREALEYLARELPNAEPVRMWSNFEFVSTDGHINEVDALILTSKGLFLVEIKSRPARALTGDAYTWAWTDGARQVETDSPLILADRKSKRLASLLAPQERREGVRLPFIETLVFCSAPGMQISLPANLSTRVFGLDRRRDDGTVAQAGIIAALTDPTVGPSAHARAIDTTFAAALTRCLDRAGVCRARPTRRIAGYKIEERLGDGPLYQDFKATHPALSITRRIRLYPYPRGASEELRSTIRRAAEREFRALETITHPNFLKPLEFADSEFGPSLLFTFDPDAVRLDHHLRRCQDSLTLDARVALIRQIAEALDFAHKSRRIHRALSPQCVWIREAGSDSPAIQLANWHAAAHAGDATTGQPSVLGATQHLSQLVEDAQAVYVAPEANRPIELTEAADVFSLGAVAYFVLTGQPPATSPLDLAERLRRGGLLLTDVLDGADPQLTDIVREATAGALSNRTQTVEDFIAGLDLWEEQATAPDTPTLNPADAHAGDELEGGYTVERRLGKGATAVAFLVRRGDERLVLKVALGPEFNDRVREEGEVLRKLHHQNIVGVHGTFESCGLTVLELDHAGDRTLARMLREEGHLSLEFLERFGDDLLSAVDYLEQQGIWHRDIKPDNIGVTPIGRGDRLHLMLFDFSLARTPAGQYRAGTPGYLDPFVQIRRPPQYDLHAERFAAAVTLYQMATGKLPAWGDGSDPAQLDCEVTLDADAMDAPLREPLGAFFRRALARDSAGRFENAEDMRRAWAAAFAAATRTGAGAAGPTPAPAGTAGIDTGAAEFTLDEAVVAAATLDTAIDRLGLSVRAVNALERLQCSTLRDMLRTPVALVFAMRGVGNKTRRELGHAFDRYRQRFADADLSSTVPEAEPEGGRLSVDAMFARLLVARERESGNVAGILNHLLGLAGWPLSLPSQSEVAQRVGVTRAYVSLTLQKPRNRWGKDKGLTELRRELAEMIGAAGGVMAPAELASAVLERRGSVELGERRERHAAAVVRAALEAEHALREPRFTIQRRGACVVVATSTEAAAYAFALGAEADRLAASEILLPSARVIEELRRVRGPASLDDARLVRLAALASSTAAVSARQELYLRGMPAARAAKLARSLQPTIAVGLAGQADILTAADIRERVRSRFPEAEPLPDRPALDEVLEQAEWNVQWDESARNGYGAYRSRVRVPLSSSSSSIVFQPTLPGARVPDDDESSAARRFDERLRAACAQGGFLLLTVPPKYLQRAERELVRQYGLQPLSVEHTLIGAMKAAASAGRVNWDIVLRTDAASDASPDWNNLQALVAKAMPALDEALPRSAPPVLLTYPGLLARYRRLNWVSDVAQRSGRADGLHGAWLLVPWEDPGALPTLDGQPIPVLPSQRAHIPDGWLANRHRIGAPDAA